MGVKPQHLQPPALGAAVARHGADGAYRQAVVAPISSGSRPACSADSVAANTARSSG